MYCDHFAGQNNQSFENDSDKPQPIRTKFDRPRPIHMHVVNKGDNVHKILGAIGQMGENEGSDDSGEARFFCAL